MNYWAGSWILINLFKWNENHQLNRMKPSWSVPGSQRRAVRWLSLCWACAGCWLEGSQAPVGWADAGPAGLCTLLCSTLLHLERGNANNSDCLSCSALSWPTQLNNHTTEKLKQSYRKVLLFQFSSKRSDLHFYVWNGKSFKFYFSWNIIKLDNTWSSINMS